MKLFFNSLLVVVMVLCGSTLHAEEDPKVVSIRKDLHLLVSPKGGNVVVSDGTDGVFIVDDQLKTRSERIESAVENITGKHIKFILNTHYHFDHTGGNEDFGKKGAIIVAHDNVRKRLSSKQFISFFNKEVEPLAEQGLPVVTFDSNMTLHYNGDVITMVHAPAAHTDGDSIAHFEKANVIAAGDIIFYGLYPFVDIEHGGSFQGVISALDMIIARANDDTVVVPGHGPLISKAQTIQYREMLKTIVAKVDAALKAGLTLEQIVASKPTKEFDDKMAQGIVSPDQLVTFVVKDLNSRGNAAKE